MALRQVHFFVSSTSLIEQIKHTLSIGMSSFSNYVQSPATYLQGVARVQSEQKAVKASFSITGTSVEEDTQMWYFSLTQQ